MKKEIIKVPYGIRYISEWNEFSLFEFPHILDKKIPGCGFTEYCITNSQDIILCSPRRILLENKEQQHSDDVLYVKNELDDSLEVDKDITKLYRLSSEIEKEREKRLQEISAPERQKAVYDHLKNEITSYIMQRKFHGQPSKLLVTYDSYHIVKDILLELHEFWKYYTVIDEFQSIFTDSRFKADTELGFLGYLEDVQRLCFVSATPMIDEYLEMLPEFNSLPYYELDWETLDPSRVLEPNFKARVTQSIVGKAAEIIGTYQRGEFETEGFRNIETGRIEIIVSKEAVFYVNSVRNILAIIKKTGIEPEDVNILCADTFENQKKIQKTLGKRYQIGKVPLQGESHKMFTFCTRTVYLGADFYSTNARTFILSDANIDSLAVDITLDLPQILGRQRLDENPWKNSADLWYKTICEDKKESKELFDARLREKKDETQRLLSFYDPSSKTQQELNSLCKKYLEALKASNYTNDYVAINKRGKSNIYPVFNNLVMISEMRAYDIQQIDFCDRFSVFNSMKKSRYFSNSEIETINLTKEKFEALDSFRKKMKYLCESEISEKERCILLDQIPLSYKSYYNIIGPEQLRALGYDITRVERRLQDLTIQQNKLPEEIYSMFNEGTRMSGSDIKEALRFIYNKLGYSRSPKASDIEEFFEIKSCKINTSEGRINGFELLKKKL